MNKSNTKLQNRLDNIDKHTKIQQMKVNTKKTKIIPFNFSRKYDFIPKYNIDGQELDVVYEAKLLGVMIRSDSSGKAIPRTSQIKLKLDYGF